MGTFAVLPDQTKDGAAMRGFDVNTALGSTQAREFFQLGYRFVVRYVRRKESHTYDLTAAEVRAIHNAGLAVGIVQHVEPGTWQPTEQKGRDYGSAAAASCYVLGVPPGVTVWLDLESVDPETPKPTIIKYCNAWFDHVKAGGWQPGIYVGYGTQLSSDELYRALKFARYWGAYNLNRDEEPAVRGLCMRQHAAKKGDRPKDVTFEIDVDTVEKDKLGGLPTVWAPDEWSV